MDRQARPTPTAPLEVTYTYRDGVWYAVAKPAKK